MYTTRRKTKPYVKYILHCIIDIEQRVQIVLSRVVNSLCQFPKDLMAASGRLEIKDFEISK